MNPVKYSGPVVFSATSRSNDSDILDCRLTGTIVLSVEDHEKQSNLIDNVVVTRRDLGRAGYNTILSYDPSTNVWFVVTTNDSYPDKVIQIGKIRKLDQAMAFILDPDIKENTDAIKTNAAIERLSPMLYKRGHVTKVNADDFNLDEGDQGHWPLVPIYFAQPLELSIKAGRGDGEYIGFEALLTSWLQEKGIVDALIKDFRKD